MNLWLKLHGTAGTSITEACADMAEVSARLKINVEVNANGVQLLCTPGETAESIEASYHAQLNARMKGKRR